MSAEDAAFSPPVHSIYGAIKSALREQLALGQLHHYAGHDPISVIQGRDRLARDQSFVQLAWSWYDADKSQFSDRLGRHHC
jgi:hypothetical protein